MRVRYLAFKWFVGLPIGGITDAFEQIGLFPDRKQKNCWTRTYGEHLLQVEYRPGVSDNQRTACCLRWLNPNGTTDKGSLDRILADWYYTFCQYAPVTVYWFQTALDIDTFCPLYGYRENAPKIWTKEDKPHRFSFYPLKDHYLFEVRNQDVRKAIQHHRFSGWLDDLKFNMLGHQRPDDQIQFDMVG